MVAQNGREPLLAGDYHRYRPRGRRHTFRVLRSPACYSAHPSISSCNHRASNVSSIEFLAVRRSATARIPRRTLCSISGLLNLHRDRCKASLDFSTQPLCRNARSPGTSASKTVSSATSTTCSIAWGPAQETCRTVATKGTLFVMGKEQRQLKNPRHKNASSSSRGL